MTKAWTQARRFLLALLLALEPGQGFADAPEPGGIGVYLGTDLGERPRIIKIIPDSPAAKARLEEGQVIMKVDGISTAEKTMADWMAMIRGPEGTAVVLEVRGADGKIFQRLIFRKKLKIPE
jgi:carboxyl-terminal processing protease